MIAKPVAQWAVAEAIVKLRAPNPETGERLSLEEACQRINKLDWSVGEGDDNEWQQVLMNGSRALAGRTVVNFAARVIAYRLGEPLTDQQLVEFREQYRDRGAGEELPEPLF